METKIGANSQIRSYVSRVKSISARRNASAASAPAQRAYSDTFTKSSASSDEDVYLKGLDMSDEMRAQLKYFNESTKNAVRLETNIIAADDYAGKTKSNFKWISMSEDGLNENLPKRLENAGVPKDVAFEFDFDFNSNNIEITGISDEKYRESVGNVLADIKGPFKVMACASRVMNGNISSLYYPWVSKNLDSCFGQDISDLYIDENGNLGGANQKLREALNAEKKANEKGGYFNAYQTYDFPVRNNIDELLKRLISDENITPNISHMGYDGERIFTNDGEFRFGKEFDPDLFGEEKYVMRGTMAFYITFYGRYNSWLENEDKFY